MRNTENIPQELIDLIPQVEKQRDDFRHKMLLESLKLLSFTFTRQKEERRFIEKKILRVAATASPGILRLYLNYDPPNEVLLAEYNDFPVINDKGQIMFKDNYYTGEDFDQTQIRVVKL